MEPLYVEGYETDRSIFEFLEDEDIDTKNRFIVLLLDPALEWAAEHGLTLEPFHLIESENSR